MRDAETDLAMLEAATPGPFNGASEQGRDSILWTLFKGAPFSGDRIASFIRAEDARIHQVSREALPEWIRRAQAAEAKLAKCIGLLREFSVVCVDDSLTERAEAAKKVRALLKELGAWTPEDEEA